MSKFVIIKLGEKKDVIKSFKLWTNWGHWLRC